MPPIRPDILSGYPPADDAARDEMIRAIQTTPIAYGTWRDLKSLYKQLEGDPEADSAVLGAMIARLDRATPSSGTIPSVSLGQMRYTNGIAAVDDKLVVVGGQYGFPDTLAVYDTSSPDPLSPALLGTAEMRGGTQLAASGPVICVGAGMWGGKPTVTLFTFDPDGKPVQRGSLTLDFDIAAIDAAYPYLYLSAFGMRRQFGGMQIVDMSDPDRPALLGRVEITSAGGSAVNDDQTVALVAALGNAFSWSRLPNPPTVRIIDISDKRRPVQIGSVETPGIRSGLIAGRYAYIGISAEGRIRESGIQVVDIANPARPVKGAFVPVGTLQIDGIKAWNGFLYAVHANTNTYVLDLVRPDVPEVVGTIDGVPFTTAERIGDRVYAMSARGIRAVGIENPRRPGLIGSPPSAQTLDYMKRRARRLLRRLSKDAPERFVDIATETLLVRGKGASPLMPGVHWVRYDLLYGGSDRFVQTRHGRGGYKEQPVAGQRLRLRRRDERAPEVWDSHLDHARRLLASGDAPWQVYEMAVKILRGAGVGSIPPLPAGALTRCLNSESPLLAAIAVRQVAALCAAGRKIKAEIAADAYYLAGSARRRVIGEKATRAVSAGAAEEPAWGDSFADRLLERIAPAGSDAVLSRRAQGALRFLAANLPAAGSGARRLALASEALLARDDVLRAWTEQTLHNLSMVESIGALRRLMPLPDELQEIALAAMESAMSGRQWSADDAAAGVFDSEEVVRVGTWRLLRASATPAETLRMLWQRLIDTTRETPAVTTAMQSSAALELLGRSGIEITAIVEAMRTRPFLAGLLQPETFRIMTQSAPISLTLAVIAAVDDAVWERLRPAWLSNLREGIGVSDLWRLAGEAIRGDDSGRLEARLLGDGEIARTFFDIDDADAVLEITEPAFSELMARWAQGRPNDFPAGSEHLLLAATHIQPDLRRWALERVASLGMEAPFALRLMESEIPPSVQAARAWFEGAPGERAADLALALCDSPAKSVQAYGREYVRAHRESLPMGRIVAALTEHSDPLMQEFVASLLRESSPDPAVAAQFDQTVLRARDRGRRAKETVKSRPDAASGIDTATLLEIARGRTPRDAEWALAEIARRAVSGETIDGVTLDGTAG